MENSTATYLDKERREKNKIIKEYQLQVKQLTLALSRLKSRVRLALDDH